MAGAPAIKFSSLAEVGDCGPFGAEHSELVVEFLVYSLVEPWGTRTSGMVIGGQPSFGRQVGAELEIPFVPMVVFTGELGGFSGVGVVGFAHRFGELLHDIENVGVGWCLGSIASLLCAFDLSLLLKFFKVFDVLGSWRARLKAMWSWRFNGGSVGADGGNCCL